MYWGGCSRESDDNVSQRDYNTALETGSILIIILALSTLILCRIFCCLPFSPLKQRYITCLFFALFCSVLVSS